MHTRLLALGRFMGDGCAGSGKRELPIFLAGLLMLVLLVVVDLRHGPLPLTFPPPSSRFSSWPHALCSLKLALTVAGRRG